MFCLYMCYIYIYIIFVFYESLYYVLYITKCTRSLSGFKNRNTEENSPLALIKLR